MLHAGEVSVNDGGRDEGLLCMLTLPVADGEKPGGSCIEAVILDFGLGGEWSSRTQEGYDGSIAISLVFERSCRRQQSPR